MEQMTMTKESSRKNRKLIVLNTGFSVLALASGVSFFVHIAAILFTHWNEITAKAIPFLTLMFAGCQAVVMISGSALALKFRPVGYKLVGIGAFAYYLSMPPMNWLDNGLALFLIVGSFGIKKILFPHLPLLKDRAP